MRGLLYLLASVALSASPVSGASDALGAALASISFNSGLTGVTRNGDSYGRHSVACYYLETENVTCTGCSWGGGCELQTLGATPQSTCSASSPAHAGFDRPGEDLASFRATNYTDCSSKCCGDMDCVAWVFVAVFQSPSNAGCDNGAGCCWLKGSVPAETPLNYSGGIWSGTTTQPPQPNITVPPTGIRNAVPVGGLGAGTLELRGDGTFHEITIHSASPAGSAKYATQPDMLLATVINGQPSSARALRTSPPAYAAPGVTSIAYRGSYPVSRLDIDDATFTSAGLSGSLYFYHHLVPGDSPTSSTPAAVFSLSITNNGASPATASLLFTIPFGGMTDCRRVDAQYMYNSSQASAADCQSACASAPPSESCAAWNFNAGTCVLLSSAGEMVFELGSSCGVAGAWDSSEGVLGFSAHPSDPDSEGGPAWGDIALSPVGSAGSSSSFAAGNVADLYESFALGGGAFQSHPGVTLGNFTDLSVIGGAVAITTPTIAPGDTATISISFSWFFPNRNYYNDIIGQFYSTRFTSARDVSAIYTNDHLVDVATAAAKHTNTWAGKDSSLPARLSDHMLNQFSHFRNFIYARDGSMREHEANDCPDLDSVHNDYQRHLPYLWAVPTFELQKSELYQSCQRAGDADDGMITENPGFHLGDSCGGRRMGDVTTIWILEVLEIWRGTNNTERLKAAWPAVVRGMEWQIRQSIDLGLPAHLVCTYDILAMERYNTTTFNGVLHLAAMKAITVMGTYLQDSSTVATASAAFATGLAAMTGPLMWNSTYGYFRAYTGGDAIMSDCLYGQQVALAHGLGWLLPVEMIASHLAAELKYNANPFGLTTVTGRKTPPPEIEATHVDIDGNSIALRKAEKAADVRKLMNELRVGGDGQDDAVWMGAAPTWSCLMLALGAEDPAKMDVTAALEPTRWELENYRSRLMSMWDLTGLSTTGDWGADSANGCGAERAVDAAVEA
jgi:uncharacterized protein (DUF608 family)